MKAGRTGTIVCLVMLSLALVSAAPGLGGAPLPDASAPREDRDITAIQEVGDETQGFRNARSLESGDVYNGHLNRVNDRADYFQVFAAQHQEINVHVYVMGHDGTDEWVRPTETIPPSPPGPVTASTMLDCYIYHAGDSPYPLDGAFNYYYVRHYVLNVCTPVPGTHAYAINISLNWMWTPNNFTWDYMLELEVSPVPEIDPGAPVEDTLDMEERDTRWYKVRAEAGYEVNGSFEILNFEPTDPEGRNVDIWVFADDLGGYSRSLAWDWSSAPNEPVEPFSILATYEGWYYLKLRGMNHVSNLPCSFRLEVHVTPVPEFPEGGIQSARFDRHHHDTDWYSFDMSANLPHDTKQGLWNEVAYFNMTERTDAGDLPDFDLYLFGLIPGSRQVDLLDSSFRNDHSDFMDPDRDPNKNTEYVRAAAFYNGTYYIEVNAFNNSGFYDLRMKWLDMRLSDGDNLPREARGIRSGIYEGHIHQAFDHYDWYAVETYDHLGVQFDSHKAFDMFNLSIYRYNAKDDDYQLVLGGWNTVFNLTSREDEVSNLIDLRVDLRSYGLGAGTYYIAVFAAVATQMAFDPDSGRAFTVINEDDATADYELKVWSASSTPPPPPPLPMPFPDTVVDEDTHLIDHLDLREYFPAGEGEFLRFKVAIVKGRLEQLILDDHLLGFQAAKDFHGEVLVRVTAITEDHLQSSQIWSITFLPVNDPPTTVPPGPPYVFNMPEDSLMELDLDDLVHDVDDGDSLAAYFDPPEHLDIQLDADTLGVTVMGAPDWFGTGTVMFLVTDAEGASVQVPVVFVVENVADPPVLLREFGTIEIGEDTTLTLDLTGYICDPDGDDLQVEVGMDARIDTEWDPSSGTLTLAPGPDWFGTRLLLVTATDPEGHILQAKLWVVVIPVPDGPRITSWFPKGLDTIITEGYERTFVVLEVVDPDSPALFYLWYLDDTLVGPSVSYTFRPGMHDQGFHEVTVEVVDEEHLRDSLTWSVLVEDVPHPPRGGIATPPEGAMFQEGEFIRFIAMYHDPDGDPMMYTWYINGEAASSDPIFESRFCVGDHHVKLQVTSDGDVVTDELYIRVVEDDGPMAMLLPLAAAASFAFLLLALALVARRRHRRPPGDPRRGDPTARSRSSSGEQFEECSKMIKYRPIPMVASIPMLGYGRTLNQSQKSIYTPQYITLPSIGNGRRGKE